MATATGRDPARAAVLRQALSIGVATGAYGISFGALAVTGGLTVAQACALSLVMFTGGSQFAFVGVVGAGGSPGAAIATAAHAFLSAADISMLLRVENSRRMRRSR